MKKIAESPIRNIISVLYIAACFAFVFLLIFKPVPAENRDMVNIMAGTLISGSGLILGYMYGYSKAQNDARRQVPEATASISINTNKEDENQNI